MSPFKIQATQMHNKLQLLDNLFIYSLTAMTSSLLLCFSPFLHPLFSCIKVLLVLPNPQIASVLFSSKFLFIVGNLIFIILIGESKIFTSYTTSTSDVCYKILDNLPPLDKKEEENLEMFFEERIITSCEGGEGQLQGWIKEKQDAEEELDGEGKLEELIEEKQDAEEEKLEERIEENQDAEEELDSEGKLEEWKEEKRDAEEELDGEGLGSPVEKLNKRVDDFIARVQKRRILELLAYTCEERESGFGEPHTKRIELIKATNW